MDNFEILHRIGVAMHYDHCLAIEINFNPLRWSLIHHDKNIFTQTYTKYEVHVQVIEHSFKILFLNFIISNKTPVPVPERDEKLYDEAMPILPNMAYYEPEYITKIREDINKLKEAIEKKNGNV